MYAYYFENKNTSANRQRIRDWSSYGKQAYEKAKERLQKVMRYSFQRLE